MQRSNRVGLSVGTRQFGRNGRGKAAEGIALLGPAVSIAAIFDARSSKRYYKEAWEEERALRAMKEGWGSQSDPDLMDILFSMMHIVRSIRDRCRNDGHEYQHDSNLGAMGPWILKEWSLS